jgi:hypothetical protein
MSRPQSQLRLFAMLLTFLNRDEFLKGFLGGTSERYLDSSVVCAVLNP